MKKFIALVALVLVSASTLMYAQESQRDIRRADRKAQRDAERARLKAEEQAADQVAYQQAVQAIKDKQFVLEADQVIFKRGQTAFVSSNTNFVMLNGQRATVQVAFNTPYPGPNGIGGVTVDGTTFGCKSDYRQTRQCELQLQRTRYRYLGTSLYHIDKRSNNATVTINPNFNSNTLTLSGNLVPLNQSDVFKGRSW